MQERCIICNKPTLFVSKKRGFRKTCSKECKKISNANIFRTCSKKYANELKNKSQRITDECSDTWRTLYLTTDLTIKQIAAKTKNSHSLIRKYLSDSGLTKTNSKLRITKNNLMRDQMENVNLLLNNENWINEQIKLGHGAHEIGMTINCSASYVAAYLKKLSRPLIKDTVSKIEIRFQNWLKKELNIPSFEVSNRTLIAPYELDIVIHEKKLAIEINGIYWHSSKCRDTKDYHLNKTNLTNDAGYELIHIYDTDIENEKMLSIIKNRLGIHTKKHFARSLQIKELDSKEYNNFCETNHFQGKCNAKYKYGLFNGNDLISIMSFSKSRFSKHTYEMIRYCSKMGEIVIGGAQRLFSKFNKEVLKIGESIITYADRSRFNGSLYERLGFNKSHNSSPGYFWINKFGHRLSRYQTQKHKLNTNLTEDQYMTKQKYYKIYDCGQSVFVLYK